MQTVGLSGEKLAVDQRGSTQVAMLGELPHQLHLQHGDFRSISLGSRLEKNLGIDSLGRTEPVLRLERAFGAADPIRLSGTDLAALVRLRDAVCAVILAGCGEPDLGELVKPAHSAGSTK
jgi:hypothetical protein